MPRSYVTIIIDNVIRESASGLAVLCEIDGEEVWMPRGQFAEPETVDVGESGGFQVTKWIADEKELEYR